MGKPMVMAAQGICYTIGLELMLAMDIRVASSDTRFGQIEVRRGIYPVGGGTVRLYGEIGWGNAMRYLLTGDEIPAAEALRLGLVQEVTEPGSEFERALEIAERIARQAPLGVQASLAVGPPLTHGGCKGRHRTTAAGPYADHEKRGRRRGEPVFPGTKGRRFQGVLKGRTTPKT